MPQVTVSIPPELREGQISMKFWINSTLAITLTLLQSGDLFAQQPQQQRPGERGSNGAQRGGGNSRTGSGTLERAGLKIGQQMPDVTIYDENGEKFSLSRVKGKHAVLVFGCLT
jgi:hypothetical protein